MDRKIFGIALGLDQWRKQFPCSLFKGRGVSVPFCTAMTHMARTVSILSFIAFRFALRDQDIPITIFRFISRIWQCLSGSMEIFTSRPRNRAAAMEDCMLHNH